MQHCTQCLNQNPGFKTQKDEAGDDIVVCELCGAENSRISIDEDALKYRLQDACVDWDGGNDAA